jgi:hypothetical protein
VRIILLIKGKQHKLKPFQQFAEAKIPCPKCGESPLQVHGDGQSVSDDDRYYRSRGFSKCCGELVGEIRAYPNTLFGLEEDERVQSGRYRVY